MKTAGISDPNPGHPKLLALLQAGADLAEFTGAAAEAVARKKGFAYALGMVANRRAEVASMAAAGLHQGALPAAGRGVGRQPFKSARQAMIEGGAAAIFDGATHV